MTNVRFKVLIDYTLKRKGDKAYYFIGEDGKILNFGIWKNKNAAIGSFLVNNNGTYKLNDVVVEHRNCSHWADFHPAKVDGNKIYKELVKNGVIKW